MCSTGFHHEELNQLNLTACKPRKVSGQGHS
jgi:hypothetical protein